MRLNSIVLIHWDVKETRWLRPTLKSGQAIGLATQTIPDGQLCRQTCDIILLSVTNGLSDKNQPSTCQTVKDEVSFHEQPQGEENKTT